MFNEDYLTIQEKIVYLEQRMLEHEELKECVCILYDIQREIQILSEMVKRLGHNAFLPIRTVEESLSLYRKEVETSLFNGQETYQETEIR